MKRNLVLVVGAIIGGTIPPCAWAQSESPVRLEPYRVNESKPTLGTEVAYVPFVYIQVKNFEDEDLGRVKDMGVDLINGRIVEALVEPDRSLGMAGRIVAVPPLALIPDPVNEVYRINVSTETFKQAAAIDLSQWRDAGRSDQVAAAYRLFGQDPYFLETGATASTTAPRPKVLLGYVERANRILDLPVTNLQNDKLGNVWSLSLDIPNGRILSVIIQAPGNYKTKSVVPAMALSFNPARDGLLLSDTKLQYADEPRYYFTAAAYGQNAYSTQENYRGPHTSVALEQGRSYRDIDQTLHIKKGIKAARIGARHVEVGTLNDRVTLRGWVATSEDQRRIHDIAVASAGVPLVDDQITVGKPIATN